MILDKNLIKLGMVVIVTRTSGTTEIFRLGKVLNITETSILIAPYQEDDLKYLLNLDQKEEMVKTLSVQFITLIPSSEIKELQIIKN